MRSGAGSSPAQGARRRHAELPLAGVLCGRALVVDAVVRVQPPSGGCLPLTGVAPVGTGSMGPIAGVFAEHPVLPPQGPSSGAFARQAWPAAICDGDAALTGTFTDEHCPARVVEAN